MRWKTSLEVKTECYYDKRFEKFQTTEKTTREYIHYYNHDHIRETKGLSPVNRTQPLN